MAADFDAVLLDIDGTLLDSTYHHALAWSRAFADAGHPVPVWRVHRLIGMGGDRLVPAVTDEETAARIGDEVKERWERAYDEMIDRTRLFPGARELLDGLRATGVEVVLASSSIPKHAEHALELLQADERADAWTTSEDAEESKPHPELLDKAMERVDASRAVMIGDATWDVVAARQRGIPTIGLRCGGFGADELLGSGAVAVYDDPADLLAHLDQALAEAASSR
jgi:HAD superfamily hydrolase (TIGR01549 family)